MNFFRLFLTALLLYAAALTSGCAVLSKIEQYREDVCKLPLEERKAARDSLERRLGITIRACGD